MRILVAVLVVLMVAMLVVAIASKGWVQLPALVASVIGSGGLLWKILAVNRDQMMLELIPARYEFALELCQTDEQAGRFLDMFMDETRSTRKG